MRFVMALCDEIYVVATGELIDHGAPDKVRANPKGHRGLSREARHARGAGSHCGLWQHRCRARREFNVAPGQCVALIGSNGAGKTTLLHAVCGLMPPVSGSILFRDANIAGEAAYRVARRGILLVPEGRRDSRAAVGARESRTRPPCAGARPSEPYASLDAVLELFPRLAERIKQIAGSLSGGEQQMLAIARALMGGPQLLLLDEPSLGLAPIVVSAVFEALKRLDASGLTILLVEQNARRAFDIARIRLRDGARPHRRRGRERSAAPRSEHPVTLSRRRLAFGPDIRRNSVVNARVKSAHQGEVSWIEEG